MSNKFNKDALRFSVLIRNPETLALINELAAKFGNRNVVLNDALDIGVRILYERNYSKEVETEKEKRQHSPSVARELKELRRVMDDLFIEMNVQETMLAGLYNTKLAQLAGDEVNAEGLIDGSLCDLPEFLAGVKADLIGVTKGNNDEQ